MVVGGRRWGEAAADYGGFGVRTGARGRCGGSGDERLWEFWGGGWSRTKLNLFQTLSCDLSFGLGYGSWRVSHGSFPESLGTF